MKEPFLDIEDSQPNIKIKNPSRPDVVVIKLTEPFNLNEYVKPACLPRKPIESGSECFVSGWGYTLRPREVVPRGGPPG